MHCKIISPIKINLALHITGKTINNYHLLDSLVIFSQDGDELNIKQANEDSFVVNGIYDWQLKNEQNNLVIKALDLLKNYADQVQKKYDTIQIELTKKLPVASGLGGGSGDAASTLILLNKIWKLNLTEFELLNLASKLGADVPACLYYLSNKKALYMSGIGDIIEPIKTLPSLHLVIINNLTKTSTKLVFSKIKNIKNTPINRYYDFINLGEFIKFLEQTSNDLLNAAIEINPSIANMLSLLKKDAIFTTMSGSGASCIGIFETNDQAQKIALDISSQYPKWFVKSICA